MVYLDAKTDTYLEEVSSCNIFVRKGKTIKTPPLAGTILPGEETSRAGFRASKTQGASLPGGTTHCRSAATAHYSIHRAKWRLNLFACSVRGQPPMLRRLLVVACRGVD